MLKRMLGLIQMVTGGGDKNSSTKDLMALSSAKSKEEARTALYSFLQKKLYETVTKDIGGTIILIL